MHSRAIVFALVAGSLWAQQNAEWTAAQEPFRIYGDTYYVGTRGLSAILITSKTGHVLIDAPMAENAGQITQHIRTLGFRVEDIKLILNSHAHFDHAGGIAELQRLSGAHVVASPWAAEALRTGEVLRSDPQVGIIQPVARVALVKVLHDRQKLQGGGALVTAHFTPGHTPGSTSWTWRSCEGSRCLNLVYADSMTPVSADGFRFTDSKVFPHAVEGFERSFLFLDKTPCDILMTPHPGASQFWERFAKRASNPDAMIDTGACRAYAAAGREGLKQRLATEAKASK